MATYNIYTRALDMLKEREEYHGAQAHKENISHNMTMQHLSEASAYNSAWWILYYAIHEDWEALDQFDYFRKEEDNGQPRQQENG